MSVCRKLLFVFSIIYLFCLSSSFAACKDVEGLYEKRVELLKKYDQEIGNDYRKNKEKADLYKYQIELIDQVYRKIIDDLFFDLEKKEYKLMEKCCGGKNIDGYFFYVCKLAAYYRDRNTGLLLDNLPVTKDKFADLWEIDRIILSDPSYYSKAHPKLLDKESFSNLFLDTIFKSASTGNVTAIDKLFKIETFADGEYGEYMEDKILGLFNNHPEVIIKSWKLVKNYKSIISFGTTDYRSNAAKIIQKYRTLCQMPDTDTLACKEIIEFLEFQKERTK